jgi:hypothetical protein
MTTLIPKFDFKNGGSTPAGAINRPIDEKLAEVLSVKDFGAIGDGTADDTVSIQATINAGVSKNKAVYFPNGSYIISATLNLPNNITLIGETQRKINDGANTYGVIIKTAGNITMMQTTAVLPDFTYGIRIENISFWGNNTNGSALVIGQDIATHLSFGITLRNIDIQYIGNGIQIIGAAYITYLENITMAGIDKVDSYGLNFRRSQIAECHSIKVENFADCYLYFWSSNIALFSSTASFNVPAISNGNNLVQMYGSFHNTFHNCVFENLATSSGSVVEVAIFEFFSDPTKSTNNRFYNCTWNGIGTSACRVNIGSSVGPSTDKTYFENCTFRAWGGVAQTFVFENSVGTVWNQCYQITGYDGSDDTVPSYSGTDTALQIYDISGLSIAASNGTWTPALDGGGSGTGVTYSAQVGYYSLTNNAVTINGQFTLSNKGATTGATAIVGLPFTAIGASTLRIPVTVTGTSLASGANNIVGEIVGASNQINLFVYSSGSLAPLTDASFTNTSRISINATYLVA